MDTQVGFDELLPVRQPVEELLAADEAFTSSSVREVMPLVEIDGRALGRGPAADELQQALRALAAKV